MANQPETKPVETKKEELSVGFNLNVLGSALTVTEEKGQEALDAIKAGKVKALKSITRNGVMIKVGDVLPKDIKWSLLEIRSLIQRKLI